MAKHSRDVVSLVMGLLFMAAAGLFLLSDLSDAQVDLRWVAPTVLIGVGILGLAASIRRRPAP
jgi:hypothetical protein